VFLLGGIAVPWRAEDRVNNVAAFDRVRTSKRFPDHRLEAANQRR
jgi:hypothetical protein